MISNRINTFHPGQRIELMKINDPYSELEQGEKGTVVLVDNEGIVHVNWDNGAILNITLEDKIKKI